MEIATLPISYFGSVEWYQSLYRADLLLIDDEERFQKQTFRNRCEIATAGGRQNLTVPIVHGSGDKNIRDTLISTHGRWQHQHWYAIQSAYGESPFFMYYADELRPFFEKTWRYLFDFDMEIVETCCRLLDIEPKITMKSAFSDEITPIETPHVFRRYYQVFEQRHGFQPNLSILDLLLCQGSESVLYL